MRRLARLTLAPAALAAVIASGTTFPTTAQTPAAVDTDDTRVPGDAWTALKPESVGYSSARLESLRSWLKTLDTKAMLIAVHGQVIFEHGDLAHASKVASVRKSVLSMLYGPYILTGRIDPRKTVVEMGLEEADPFLPRRRMSTAQGSDTSAWMAVTPQTHSAATKAAMLRTAIRTYARFARRWLGRSYRTATGSETSGCR